LHGFLKNRVKEIKKKIKIDGKEVTATFSVVEESDRAKLRKLFDDWKKLSSKIKKFSGKRGLNIPEGITEMAFALERGCPRLNKLSKGKKFDNYDLKKKERLQIKASSNSKSPSSFGPSSVSDVTYYLDFDRNGKLDGSFDCYRIPNKKISGMKVNRKQSVGQQRGQKRRPRFSVMDIIKKNKIRKRTYSI